MKEFVENLTPSQHSSLSYFSVWGLALSKGADYEFLMSELPNLCTLLEDYDCSGLYDERLEIEEVFACNAGEKFAEKDLEALVKLMKNWLRVKNSENGKNDINDKNYKENFGGMRKGLRFTLFNNFELIEQIFRYLKEKKEDYILNNIDRIHVEVGVEGEVKPLEGLKSINYVNLEEENIYFFLKNVESVRILEGNEELIDDVYLSKKPMCIKMNKKISDKTLSILEKSENLKFLVCDENEINEDLRKCVEKIGAILIEDKYCVD